MEPIKDPVEFFSLLFTFHLFLAQVFAPPCWIQINTSAQSAANQMSPLIP